MKKKKKKFESLKSILILLQQIQANDFGPKNVVISYYINDNGEPFVTSSIICKNEKTKSFKFYDCHSLEEREKTYND